MLHKDQYDQDEYNNYYKQETERAEIKGYSEDEGGFLKKAILLLGLIALGVAGYFGFKTFTSTSDTVTKEKLVIKEEAPKASETSSEVAEDVSSAKNIEDKVIETIETNKEKVEKNIQAEVETQVQDKIENNNKMSSADISKIVDLVMNKIDKENIRITETNNENDNDLLSALENSVDDTEEIKTNKTVIANVESVIETKTEDVKTNNKVTVDNSTNTEDTDLTALSEQIKTLLNMSGSTTPTSSTSRTISTTSSSSIATPTSYEESITQEIKVRKNEMRIIVVKRGDTLNKIAQRAYGSAKDYQKIYDANPDIRRADRIYVGQKLRIPK